MLLTCTLGGTWVNTSLCMLCSLKQFEGWRERNSLIFFNVVDGWVLSVFGSFSVQRSSIMSPHVGNVTPEHTHTHTSRSPGFSSDVLSSKYASHLLRVTQTFTAAAAGTSSVFYHHDCYQFKQPVRRLRGWNIKSERRSNESKYWLSVLVFVVLQLFFYTDAEQSWDNPIK